MKYETVSRLSYTGCVVSPQVQEALSTLSADELVEVRAYIDHTLASTEVTLTEDEQAVILRRSAEMDADPSLGKPARQVGQEILAELARRKAA
ncbi:MAG: hypothetical protein LBR20_07030 [Propionibacteriaceae bacterium]|jgi:hypothetical protein|nr:hypothetical protein [Propionibacteriaceae bacterium]